MNFPFCQSVVPRRFFDTRLLRKTPFALSYTLRGLLAAVLVAFLICFMPPFSVGLSQKAYADDAAKADAVKVGYVLSPRYQEGAEGEYKSGLGYEYLQNIAGYTGWEYDYVYGSFGEMLDKLEKGEIDIMGNISYTAERAKLVDFGSFEQGRESFCLYVANSQSEISSKDHSTLDGKTIGVVKDTYQENLWSNWCDERGITCRFKEFPTGEEQQEALENGSVDATVASTVSDSAKNTPNRKIVMIIGDAPFYFATNKNKPELVKQLNDAQEKILDENPFYNEEVSIRYSANDSLVGKQLSDEEKQWLKEHDGRIKVGCLDNFFPSATRLATVP